MELLHQDSRSSVRFLESKRWCLLPCTDITEPSFLFRFLQLNCVQDDDGSVIQAYPTADYTLIGSRSDFPASVLHNYLQTRLAEAGLFDPEIQDLWLKIESTAKTIAQGRDAQPMIPVELCIEMYVSLQEELEAQAEIEREIDEQLAAALENESESDESDPEMTEEFMEVRYGSDPEESSGEESNEQVSMAVEASMQENVARMVPASVESMEALKNKALPEAQSVECCAICAEKLGTVVKVMPCSHYFHQDCIFLWLDMNHVCPLCRFELPTRSID